VLQLRLFNRSKKIIKRAQEMIKKGNYQEALEYYDKILDTDPNYAKALNGKGFILLRRGEYKEALESFNKSLMLNQDLESALKSKKEVLKLMEN
jgi:tetratricopeptide (TPR) repeat protein